MSVFAIAFGSIIGFACFVLPGNWLLDAGPLGAAIAFVIATLMILVIANSYGYMVRRLPFAGGAVVYAYRGFGRRHAFLCGWLLSMGFLSVVALNAMAMPLLVRFVAPDLLIRGYLYTVAGYEVYAAEVALSMGIILLFGNLNIRDSGKIGNLQVLMVSLLFAAVIMLGIGSFVINNAGISNLKPFFAQDKTVLGAILSILAIAPMAFVGFDTIPHAAEEFDFPASMASKLMFSAIIAGGLMYVVVLLSTAVVFPWNVLNNSLPGWATGTAMKSSMGYVGLTVLLIGVTMGICTGINGFYMATSRLLFGMAQSQILPGWFSQVHPKYKTPANAITFCMILALIAPWFGRTAILWVVDMCALGAAISFFYTCYTAYKLNRSERSARFGGRIHLLSTFFSVGFIAMLVIPGSPALMSKESILALLVWAGLGLAFYAYRAKEYNLIPADKMDRLVYGMEEQA